MCQRHGSDRTPTLPFESKNHVSIHWYNTIYAIPFSWETLSSAIKVINNKLWIAFRNEQVLILPDYCVFGFQSCMARNANHMLSATCAARMLWWDGHGITVNAWNLWLEEITTLILIKEERKWLPNTPLNINYNKFYFMEVLLKCMCSFSTSIAMHYCCSHFIVNGLTYCDRDKMASICRRYFKIYFLEWKSYVYPIYTDVF